MQLEQRLHNFYLRIVKVGKLIHLRLMCSAQHASIKAVDALNHAFINVLIDMNNDLHNVALEVLGPSELHVA